MPIGQSLQTLISSVLLNLSGQFVVGNLKCFILAFLLSCLGMPLLIKIFKVNKMGQTIRNDGPKRHLQKSGTPTMGGVVIILAVLLTTLVFIDLHAWQVWIILCTLLSFGGIGFIDDYLKISGKNKKGLCSRDKFLLQTAASILVIVIIYCFNPNIYHNLIYLPFSKSTTFSLSFFYFLLMYIMLVGTSNAVNLTDGLDGLAIFPIIMVFIGLIFCVFISVNIGMLQSINIPGQNVLTQISWICSAIVGAGLGFLWFNCYPATIFMGDSGSLSLGATMAVVAILLQQELMLIILGGVFVLETISVIIQVGYFKMTKRRVFKMAPIHHHFELMGWSETKVIVRFWILSILFLVLSGIAIYY